MRAAQGLAPIGVRQGIAHREIGVPVVPRRYPSILLGSFVLVSVGRWALAAEPAASSGAVVDVAPDPFTQAVDQAQSAHRAGRWTEAIRFFDEAMLLAESDAERAIIGFNAGVAAYDAGNYADAERRFRSVLPLEEAQRVEVLALLAQCRLQLGDISGAREFERLATAEEGDSTQLEDLRQAILDREHSESLSAWDRRFGLALAAYRRGQSPSALQILEGLKAELAQIDLVQKVSFHLLLGHVQRDLGDDQGAKISYETSQGLDPSYAEPWLALGDLLRDLGELSAARAAYERAARLDDPEDARTRAHERLDALYPVPDSAWNAEVGAQLGYDTNAAQSGSAQAIGLSGAAASGSPFLDAALFLERPLRTDREVAWAPWASASALVFTESPAQELSFFSGELGFSNYLAFGPEGGLKTSAHAALFLSGLAELAPFTWEIGIRSELSLVHSRTLSSRLALSMKRSNALEATPALNGSIFDLRFRESIQLGRFGGYLEGSTTYQGLSTFSLGTDGENFSVCDDPDQAALLDACRIPGLYQIPLGYVGVGLLTSQRAALGARFSLVTSAGISFRHYLGDSVLRLAPGGPGRPLGPEVSRKTREDLRLSGGIEVRRTLGQGDWLELSLGYSVLESLSNISQSNEDEAQYFDFDQRNFTQHQVTIGANALF